MTTATEIDWHRRGRECQWRRACWQWLERAGMADGVAGNTETSELRQLIIDFRGR